MTYIIANANTDYYHGFYVLSSSGVSRYICVLILTGCKFSSVLFITAQVDIKNNPKSTIVYNVMHCSTITSACN